MLDGGDPLPARAGSAPARSKPHPYRCPPFPEVEGLEHSAPLDDVILPHCGLMSLAKHGICINIRLKDSNRHWLLLCSRDSHAMQAMQATHLDTTQHYSTVSKPCRQQRPSNHAASIPPQQSSMLYSIAGCLDLAQPPQLGAILTTPD